MPFDQIYAREVLAYIKANPEQHDQEIWARQLSCETVGCFAYHVCRMKGFEADLKRIVQHDRTMAWLTTGDVIAEKATEILGANDDQANSLFDSDNTIEDLERFIENPALMGDCDNDDDELTDP